MKTAMEISGKLAVDPRREQAKILLIEEAYSRFDKKSLSFDNMTFFSSMTMERRLQQE